MVAVEFVSRQRENTGTVAGLVVVVAFLLGVVVAFNLRVVVSWRVVVEVKFCLGLVLVLGFDVVVDLKVDFWVCSKSCYNCGFILLLLLPK